MRADRIDDLLKETRDTNPNRRRAAVRELCPCDVRADIDSVWSRIFELASDDDPGVRRLVFHAMIDGSPRARHSAVVGAIERMRDDPHPKLRRQVRKLLANYERTGKINIDLG